MNVWTSEKEFQYSEQSWPESAAIRHIRQGFVDRHCQSSVVDRLFVVESKFVNDIVELSVKEVRV
jgi:hypothetical protein